MTLPQEKIDQINLGRSIFTETSQGIMNALGGVKKKTIFTGENFITDGITVNIKSIKKIVINGCGGTGGWFIPKLAKILYDASLKQKLADNITIYFCDGDTVANKNLIRQNFILRDVGSNKAEVLANRYTQLFPATINVVYIDKYIANKDIINSYPAVLRSKFVDINTLPFKEDISYTDTTLVFNFVDNSVSRRCIHAYFAYNCESASIVMDAGNNLYNGQVNTSIYYPRNHGYTPAPCNYFMRNIEELMESDFVKLENCADADTAVNNPEQMFNVNDFSATVTANITNCLIADGKLHYGLVSFVTGATMSVVNSYPFYGVYNNTVYPLSPFFHQMNRGIAESNTAIMAILSPSISMGGRNAPVKYEKQYDMVSDSEEIATLASRLALKTSREAVKAYTDFYQIGLMDFRNFVDANKQATTMETAQAA